MEILDGAEQLSFEGLGATAAQRSAPSPSFTKWSYSRRGTLEQCPLRYYFDYYGSHLRMAKIEPRKERLRFLKKLSNRYLRTGTIAHLIIRTYFRRLQRGEEWSSERAIGWAREIYHDDLEFSRGYKQDDLLSDDLRAPVLLMEFYFGLSEAEALWAESEERLVGALTNFFTSPKIEPYRLGGSSPDALVEKSLGIKQERFSITGKLDLAYTEGDRVVVVDWKTGGAGGGDEGLQLYT